MGGGVDQWIGLNFQKKSERADVYVYGQKFWSGVAASGVKRSSFGTGVNCLVFLAVADIFFGRHLNLQFVSTKKKEHHRFDTALIGWGYCLSTCQPLLRIKKKHWGWQTERNLLWKKMNI